MADQIDLSGLNNPNGDEPRDENSVSLDDLHNIEVNQADVDDTLRRGLLPQGTYLTNPDEFGEMAAFPRMLEEKDDAGNITGRRLVVALRGRGRAKVRIKTGYTVESKTVEGRVDFEISPDVRRKLNWETKEPMDSNDLRSTLYAQATKAYQAHFGERPKSVAQVVEYLQKFPIKARMIQIGVPTKNRPEPDGEPRNLVMVISAAR